MKLRYTPRAREDLLEIKQYIAIDLYNPSAADSVIQNIVNSCSKLKEYPNMGIDLSKKIERDTELRYIITGKYLAFYHVEENYISIIRILDSRTNYMKILFESQI